MNAARRRARWIRRTVKTRWRRFAAALDSESVTTFQTMYYVLIVTAGLYLWLVARIPTQALEETLGSIAYSAWLALNIICPAMSLYGRRLFTVASRIKPGEPNPGLLGAWLQAIGDSGVWGAISIYVACIINTSYWGQSLYASFFVLMGVPGGFMFTLRSWRRICQINARAKRLPK